MHFRCQILASVEISLPEQHELFYVISAYFKKHQIKIMRYL